MMLKQCLKDKFDWLSGYLGDGDPYLRIFFDERTPWISRFLVALALGYFFYPIDIIPDILPIIGQMDDVVMIAVLLYFAKYYIPEEVKKEYWPDLKQTSNK